MFRIISTTLFLVFSALPLNAQKISLELGLNYSRLPDQLIEYNSQQYSYQSLDDERQIKTNRWVLVQSEFGAENTLPWPRFGANISWDISERLGFSYGLNLDLSSYKIGRKGDSNIIIGDIISVDTIAIRDEQTTNPMEGICDSIVINARGRTIDDSYTIIDLEHVFLLSYKVIPEKMSLSFGFGISTPLYTDVLSESFLRNEREEDGQTICYYNPIANHDSSGDGFTKLKGFIRLATHLHFSRNWHLNFGYSVGLRSIFTQADGQDFVMREYEARPNSTYLSVSYMFGKKDKIEVKDDNF